MPKTDCTPLQELAAYAALPGGIKRPEEYLRLARLALAEVARQVDKHPTMPNGDKWRLLNSHPSEGGAGLTVLSRLIEHTEARLLEALEEAEDSLPALLPDVLGALPDDLYLHAEEPVPPYSQRRGVDVHHAGEVG
jgi:hypothetical protein